MSIWGIIIGGTAGFALGGPIGGLLGAVAGHAVESKFTPSGPDPKATNGSLLPLRLSRYQQKWQKRMVLLHTMKLTHFEPAFTYLQPKLDRLAGSGI